MNRSDSIAFSRALLYFYRAALRLRIPLITMHLTDWLKKQLTTLKNAVSHTKISAV